MQGERLRRLVLVTIGAGAIGVLTGCVTTTASGGTECARWRPIAWSRADTDDTIRAVKEHNAAWEALCRD